MENASPSLYVSYALKDDLEETAAASPASPASPACIERLDVVFSGGGMAGLYQLGVVAYMASLIQAGVWSASRVGRIYGTSAGCLSSIFLALVLSDPSSSSDSAGCSVDRIMKHVNANLHHEYAREGRSIVRAWINILGALLPENVHEICSHKVFITINVFDRFRFKNKVVSRFASKEHLLDVVHTSMALPWLTIPGLWKTYVCPFEGRSYAAVDGLFNAAPVGAPTPTTTLFVNILVHKYPFVKRLHIFEYERYDWLVIEGIQAAKSVFSCGAKKGEPEPERFYFYSNNPVSLQREDARRRQQEDASGVLFLLVDVAIFLACLGFFLSKLLPPPFFLPTCIFPSSIKI